MKPLKTKYRFFLSTLSGSTMIELLIVMLVTGIVFLMAFEGLGVIRQYSTLVSRKLMQKSTLLYSHQVFEALMEKSDSIRMENQKIIFYTEASDAAEKCLVIDSTSLRLLHHESSSEVLFPEMVHISFYFSDKNRDLIDSIFITVKADRDTLKFNYGLSPFRGTKLNVFSE